MGDRDGTLKADYDAISMKTKPILTRFGGTFGTLTFDEKSFLDTLKVSHHIGIRNPLMQFMLIPQVYLLVKNLQI